jgi:hypothetical protein
MQNEKLPVYEAPQVTTMTDEEILEELGEAHAYRTPPP